MTATAQRVQWPGGDSRQEMGQALLSCDPESGVKQILVLEPPMLPTYPAILRNGRLEWGNEGAPVVSPNQSIRVHVTVLALEDLPVANGSAMAGALAAIATAGGPANFGDPLEWQRESRADRTLPGRDE